MTTTITVHTNGRYATLVRQVKEDGTVLPEITVHGAYDRSPNPDGRMTLNLGHPPTRYLEIIECGIGADGEAIIPPPQVNNPNRAPVDVAANDGKSTVLQEAASSAAADAVAEDERKRKEEEDRLERQSREQAERDRIAAQERREQDERDRAAAKTLQEQNAEAAANKPVELGGGGLTADQSGFEGTSSATGPAPAAPGVDHAAG